MRGIDCPCGHHFTDQQLRGRTVAYAYNAVIA